MDSKDSGSSKTSEEEVDMCDSASGSDRKPSDKRPAKGKKLKKDDSGINVLLESDNSDDLSDSGTNTSNCEDKELGKCNPSEPNSSDSGNLESSASASVNAKAVAKSEMALNSNIPVDNDDEGEFSELSTVETSSTADCDDSTKKKKSKCKRKNSSDEEDDDEREELKRMKEEEKYDPIPSTPKPIHCWSAPKSFLSRQYGHSSKYSPDLFRFKCYGSLHMVQRLELMYKMKKHDGCVNTLNFNSSGTKLVTGSDDLDIILWDSTTSEPIFDYNSGHTSNVLQIAMMKKRRRLNQSLLISILEKNLKQNVAQKSAKDLDHRKESDFDVKSMASSNLKYLVESKNNENCRLRSQLRLAEDDAAFQRKRIRHLEELISQQNKELKSQQEAIKSQSESITLRDSDIQMLRSLAVRLKNTLDDVKIKLASYHEIPNLSGVMLMSPDSLIRSSSESDVSRLCSNSLNKTFGRFSGSEASICPASSDSETEDTLEKILQCLKVREHAPPSSSESDGSHENVNLRRNLR